MSRNVKVVLGGAVLVIAVVLILMRGAFQVEPDAPVADDAPAATIDGPPAAPPPTAADRVVAPVLSEVPADPTPTPDEPAAAPVREYGPETWLYVRDAADRAELLGVTALALPDVYWSAGWKAPPPRRALLTNAVSPLCIRAWWYEGDDPDLARGIEVRHAGADDAVSWAEDSFRISRGMVFFARDAGHAWGRANVDLAQGGRHELLCAASAGLRVRLVNARPDEWAKLGRDVHLYVRSGNDVVTERKLTADVLRDEMHLTHLEPGEYALSVEIGEWWEFQSRVTLGEAAATIAAGAEPTVEIVLDDPPTPLPRAPVAGTLTFPSFPDEQDVVLRLFHADTYSQGEATAELPLGAMTRVAPEARTWAFDAGELPTGAYQAKVWPFLVSTTFVVPPDGVRDLAITVGALAEVRVAVVDGATRAPAPLEELFWSNVNPLEGQVNHLGLTIPFAGEPGRFVFHTAPGSIDLSADPQPPSPYGYTTGDFEVQAGVNAIELRLIARCGVRVVLRDDGAILPIGELHHGVGCIALDGGGRVTIDRLRTEGALELSAPGRYRISFPSVGPPRYRPVDDREVLVEPGAWRDVVVDLQRP